MTHETALTHRRTNSRIFLLTNTCPTVSRLSLERGNLIEIRTPGIIVWTVVGDKITLKVYPLRSRRSQSSCGAKIQICRTLMNRPEIVSVGVVWDSERPSLEHIMDVFATVGTCLRLSDVFHSVVDSRWGATTVHNLVGVVTYYGKHYSTFFFHTKLKVSLVDFPSAYGSVILDRAV